ncbi:MAG: ribonuclease HII [Flavobacteriales bacterium]|nr:ribonuclease HII [Flavobacteriales bacterium]
MSLAPCYRKDLLEAGCDEAGRGCLAGPVVAAAVLLPPGARIPGLNDSKKLSAGQRAELRPLIMQKAIAWAVAEASAEEIDRINILNASFLAMHRAIAALSIPPQHLLIDGNRFNPYTGIPHTCMVKGDGRFRNIAAASVLAKTHRDALMEQLALDHPHYGWRINKGYPTPDHRHAIAQHGPCLWHRRSFRLLADAAVPL